MPKPTFSLPVYVRNPSGSTKQELDTEMNRIIDAMYPLNAEAAAELAAQIAADAARAEAAADITVYSAYTFILNGNGTSNPITLPLDGLDTRMVELSTNTGTFYPNVHYTVEDDQLELVPGSDLDVWPLGTANMMVRIKKPVDTAALEADNITLDEQPLDAVLRGGGPGTTRAQLVVLNDAGAFASTPDGTVVHAGGHAYRRLAASTAIADLPGLVPEGVVVPAHFNAVGDGVADDWAQLQAAITYIQSFNPDLDLDLSRRRYAVSQTLVMSTSKSKIKNGELRAHPSFTAGVDGHFLLALKNQRCVATDIVFICDGLADGVSSSGYASEISGCEVQNFRANGYGIRITGDADQSVRHNLVTQSQQLIAGRTGIGISVEGGDCKLLGNVSRFSRRPLYIAANTALCIGNHFYNGGSGAIDGPPTNTINIEIAAGTGIQIHNTYLDKGRVLFSGAFGVMFHGLHMLFATPSDHASVFIFDAGNTVRATLPDGLTVRDMSGTRPLTTGSLAFIELIATGTGSWGANAVQTVAQINAQQDHVELLGRSQGTVATRDRAQIFNTDNIADLYLTPAMTNDDQRIRVEPRPGEWYVSSSAASLRLAGRGTAPDACFRAEGGRTGIGSFVAGYRMQNRHAQTGQYLTEVDMTYAEMRMLGSPSASSTARVQMVRSLFGTTDETVLFEWGINVTESALPLRVTPSTVAALPGAATVGTGARAFVTDATATTFNSIVAGGGSNFVPVFSDGTNWRIG